MHIEILRFAQNDEIDYFRELFRPLLACELGRSQNQTG
jgi:hypothetical protein